jgi:hypothetical protein
MATKTKRRRGRPRTGAKWKVVDWVEDRAEIIAERQGNAYGAVMKACRAYAEKFLIDETIDNLPAYQKRGIVNKKVAQVRKQVKNAQEEWRKAERIIKAARAGDRRPKSTPPRHRPRVVST